MKIRQYIKNYINGNSSIPNDKQRMCTYMGNNRILTTTIYGQKIFCAACDISLTPHIIIDGCWEPWITKVFLDLIKQDMVVLDIGANIGWYSLLAASIVGENGKVIAFEANPELADIIASNFAINGYHLFSEVQNIAVYSDERKISFGILQKYLGGSSIWMTEQGANGLYDHVKFIDIPAKPLDAIFPAGTQVDFIKMDAEGAEWQIINGGKRLINENRALSIIMEYSIKRIEKDVTIDEFIDKIYGYGFKIYEITTDSQLIPCNKDRAKNLEFCDILLTRDGVR